MAIKLEQLQEAHKAELYYNNVLVAHILKGAIKAHFKILPLTSCINK